MPSRRSVPVQPFIASLIASPPIVRSSSLRDCLGGSVVDTSLAINWTLVQSMVRSVRHTMNNIFYIIGVVVVVLAILGYLGLR
jgi:hypothetical protein